jgi:hypothetical protein
MYLRHYVSLALLLVAAGGAAKAASDQIYDEKAQARQQVSAAIAQASKSGKNVVLVFGANW